MIYIVQSVLLDLYAYYTGENRHLKEFFGTKKDTLDTKSDTMIGGGLIDAI